MRQWLASAPAGAVLVWAAAGLAAGAAPLAGQTPPQEPTVTMAEAVERALQVSPTMVQRQGAVQTSHSAERVAWGDFIPSLSFSSGASYSSSNRFNPQTNTSVTGSSESYNARLSTSLELFTGGRRRAQLRQTRAQTDAAEAAVVEQRFAVALQAKQAFFNVLRNDDLIRVSEERIQRAQDGLEAAILRTNVGSATRSDSLRAAFELTQARQQLLTAQTSRRNAAHTLGALIGYDGPVAARAEAPLEPRPLELADAELLQMVLEQAPGVQTARANLRSSEAAVSSSRSQWWPSLSMSGGYTWNNQQFSLNQGSTSWSTGVSLSYPIFNGFSREDANERANVNLTVSRAQLEDQQRQVRATLEQVLNDLRLAEQQIALAQEALLVAQEDLRVLNTRYGLGAATILDLITSQVAVTQADIDLIAARFDYQIARAQLEALIGREL
ncbi:MAG TPA: TolC family protein [Vicinamibacterales bacterium]